MRFQMNLFLNFVTQILDSFDGCMLNLLETLGHAFFNFLGNPEPFDQIKAHDAKHDNHQQDLAEMAKVADQSHYGAAEKITRAAENQNPKKATGDGHQEKPQVAHATHAMKDARRPTQAVDVFGKKNRYGTKTLSQLLDAWFRGAIETKSAYCFAKPPARSVSNVVAGNAAQRPKQEHPEKAVIAKEGAVSQDAGQQQCDVSFKHHEEEDSIQTILSDQLREKLQGVHVSKQ